MSKSKFMIDKLAKLIEQGLVSYKDLSSEILNILRSKRDEIVFKMKITSKEETEILNKRVENLEKNSLVNLLFLFSFTSASPNSLCLELLTLPPIAFEII